MPHWTSEQWYAFTGILTAGLAAVALLAMAVRAVRGWTAPAHAYAVCGPAPRPTLALAARRASVPTLQPAPLEVIRIDPLPADVAEHVAPGPGSITSLLREEGHCAPRVDSAIDPDVRRWFAEAFDRPAHAPLRDEAGILDEGGVLTRFRAAVEPAMRTAHLWEIQGRGVNGHTSARQVLDRWRIDTPTGEYPLVPA